MLVLSQLSCHPSRQSHRLIVASAGKIISLDPAQANTFHALQIISALGDTLYEIDEKIDSNLDYLLNTPYLTPVRRLNETLANRELDVRYEK